ncbi:helix-turn-helix domain-containing protein [Pseudotenacibaculum haliotis]|uniref:Helix-turn-helix domain-containing protein n=1 Tax=Pseudotenacibaculum haliotis TaxID=1862138 RepID=A0ABW5LQI6_9FLAO
MIIFKPNFHFNLYIATLLWLCSFTLSWAQSSEILFEEITISSDDGLQSWENIDVFYEDDQGIIWALIEGGLYQFNGHTATNVTHYLSKKHPVNIDQYSATSFLIDNNIIWYGTRKGLFKIDLKNRSSEKVFLDKPLHQPNWRNYILELQKQDHLLYVGTSNGLYLVDTKSTTVLKKYLTDGIDVNHRDSSHAVESFYIDTENDLLWVAMPDGFYQINTGNDQVDQYQIQDAPYAYPHNFHDIIRDNNVFLMPSHGLGIVEFDLKTKQFSRFETESPLKEWNRTRNIIRSALPLNDSILLVNAVELGNGLYHKNTKKYQWLKTPEPMKNGVFLNPDKSGYVWAAKRGRIFRSVQPILKSSEHFKPTLDISSLQVDSILKSRPSLDRYESIVLTHDAHDITIDFSLTKPYVFDSISYRYSINSESWKKVLTPNTLTLNDISTGQNLIQIQAIDAQQRILASQEITLIVPKPFYRSVYFIILVSLVICAIVFFLMKYKRALKQSKASSEAEKKLRIEFSNKVLLKVKDLDISSTEKQFLDKVQKVLNKRLTDSSFSADEFSHALGMSRMQLHRKLKSLTDMSTSEFIRIHRLKLAAELLKKSDTNISQVSYSVGFNDPAYFSKCFKELFLCTPSEYSKK